MQTTAINREQNGIINAVTSGSISYKGGLCFQRSAYFFTPKHLLCSRIIYKLPGQTCCLWCALELFTSYLVKHAAFGLL